MKIKNLRGTQSTKRMIREIRVSIVNQGYIEGDIFHLECDSSIDNNALIVLKKGHAIGGILSKNNSNEKCQHLLTEVHYVDANVFSQK